MSGAPAASPARPPPSRLAAARVVAGRVGRPLALVVGLAIAAYFVRSAGVTQIAAVVRSAGVWLPPIVVLQVVVVACDTLALRLLVSDAPSKGKLRSWLSATALANACSVFLPAGRAAGEAVRGTVLAASVGGARAGRAAVRLQACSLLGTATACAVAAAVARRAVGPTALPALLAVSAGLSGGLGAGVLFLARSAHADSRLVRLLSRVIPRVARGWDADAIAPATSFAAFSLCVLGRVVQAVQYGVGILAVGGRFEVTSAVVADGIQLVGSTGGDLLPGQLGALEAAYTAFADALGLPDAAARAMSLVVIMRGALVGLALVGLLLAAALPPERAGAKR